MAVVIAVCSVIAEAATEVAALHVSDNRISYYISKVSENDLCK